MSDAKQIDYERMDEYFNQLDQDRVNEECQRAKEQKQEVLTRRKSGDIQWRADAVPKKERIKKLYCLPRNMQHLLFKQKTSYIEYTKEILQIHLLNSIGIHDLIKIIEDYSKEYKYIKCKALLFFNNENCESVFEWSCGSLSLSRCPSCEDADDRDYEFVYDDPPDMIYILTKAIEENLMCKNCNQHASNHIITCSIKTCMKLDIEKIRYCY